MKFELFWLQICPKTPTWILLGASLQSSGWLADSLLWSVEQLQSWPQTVSISLDMYMLSDTFSFLIMNHRHCSYDMIRMQMYTCKKIEQQDIPLRSGFPKFFLMYQYLFILIHLHWKLSERITWTVCIPAIWGVMSQEKKGGTYCKWLKYAYGGQHFYGNSSSNW